MEYRIIGDDGKEYGPVGVEQLREWAAQGRVSPSSLVFRSDTGRWAHAINYEELSGRFRAAPAAGPEQAAAGDESSSTTSTGGFAGIKQADGAQPETPIQAHVAQTRQMMPGRGTTILVFGIVSIAGSFLFSCACIGFFFGPAFGIPAWVMGAGDLRRIAMGQIAPSEARNTRAGMILGIIGTFIGPVVAAVASVAAFFHLLSGPFFE